MTITTIIAAALGSIGAYFTWKASTIRQRRAAEADIKKQQENLEMKKNEIRTAVFNNDDDKLNKIVSDLVTKTVVCIASLSLVFGCASNTVYVPTDRRVESVTNSMGIACKAVPDALFADMLVQLQELKDLKTELKVDKRVGNIK